MDLKLVLVYSGHNLKSECLDIDYVNTPNVIQTPSIESLSFTYVGSDVNLSLVYLALTNHYRRYPYLDLVTSYTGPVNSRLPFTGSQRVTYLLTTLCHLHKVLIFATDSLFSNRGVCWRSGPLGSENCSNPVTSPVSSSPSPSQTLVRGTGYDLWLLELRSQQVSKTIHFLPLHPETVSQGNTPKQFPQSSFSSRQRR